MSNICKRCGDIIGLSIETIRVENKGLCELCVKEYVELVNLLDKQRKEAFLNFNLKSRDKS